MTEKGNGVKTSDPPAGPEKSANGTTPAAGDVEEDAHQGEAPEPKVKEKEPEPPKEEEAKAEPPTTPKDDRGKASWGAPLHRFDAWWTRTEARLCTVVLFAEILALCLWVSLKGMSAEYHPGADDKSGLIYRGIIGAVVLGAIANRITRPKKWETATEAERKSAKQRQIGAVTIAVVVGALSARLWANAGSAYFSNVLNWMQSASTLTLLGGLRGLATRLTLWVALLGASLATAQGKHINVDVVMRFVPVRLRVWVAVLGWVAAATMCATATWGFVDHLMTAEYNVRTDEPCANEPLKSCPVDTGTRLGEMKKEIGRDFFLMRRQMALDWMSFPKVVSGTKYKDYLHAKEWNAWLADGDWAAYFKAEDVEGQKMDEARPDDTRMPLINIPGTGENTNGLLVRDVDFIFPFGLVMIALRFLLRTLLAIAGWVKVDPDAAHAEPEVEAKAKEAAT